MTEARGHLQEAPREGAAVLVARASVTASPLPLVSSLCVDLLTFWPSSIPRNGGRGLVSDQGTVNERRRQPGRKQASNRRECLVAWPYGRGLFCLVEEQGDVREE